MRILIAICLLLVAAPLEALAYLDPGTGSIFLQMLIAGIVSVLFALKMFWRRLVGFFSSIFKEKK